MAVVSNFSIVTDTFTFPPTIFVSNTVQTTILETPEPIVPVFPDVSYVCDICLLDKLRGNFCRCFGNFGCTRKRISGRINCPKSECSRRKNHGCNLYPKKFQTGILVEVRHEKHQERFCQIEVLNCKIFKKSKCMRFVCALFFCQTGFLFWMRMLL